MNYSQHEVHSAHVAHEVHSPHVQVVQQVFTQHDLASETSAFCGAKLNKNRIAEKRMMDFIIKQCLVFRITMLKTSAMRRKNAVNPKSKTLAGKPASAANAPRKQD